MVTDQRAGLWRDHLEEQVLGTAIPPYGFTISTKCTPSTRVRLRTEMFFYAWHFCPAIDISIFLKMLETAPVVKVPEPVAADPGRPSLEKAMKGWVVLRRFLGHTLH